MVAASNAEPANADELRTKSRRVIDSEESEASAIEQDRNISTEELIFQRRESGKRSRAILCRLMRAASVSESGHCPKGNSRPYGRGSHKPIRQDAMADSPGGRSVSFRAVIAGVQFV
jgi:hypothetical protein